MILGILSDTHGDTDAVKRVYAALPNADAWAFLGDGQREANWLREHSAKPVYTVKGNCDAGDIAEEQVITLGGVRIFMTHGHAYAIALNSYRLMLRAQELDCAVALYGHTPVSGIEYAGGVQIVCPGSPSVPRRGRRKSFAKLEIENGSAMASIVAL